MSNAAGKNKERRDATQSRLDKTRDRDRDRDAQPRSERSACNWNKTLSATPFRPHAAPSAASAAERAHSAGGPVLRDGKDPNADIARRVDRVRQDAEQRV